MKKKPIYYTFRECILGNDRFLTRFLSFLSLFFIGNIGIVVAQDAPKFTVNFKDASLIEIFDYFGKKSDYRFTYNSENVKKEAVKITEFFKEATLEQILTKCLGKTQFDYHIVDKHVMIAPRKKLEVALIKVSGRVVDEKGNPIPGATIVIVGTTQGVASDAEGRYTIAAKPNDVLRVSFIGYKSETVDIKGKEKIDVRLNPTAENIEEVTVVAFGEQKRESVVSAITTVRPMDLKSSSSDLTSSLAGRIAGVIGWQTGGLPGALTEEEMNTKFYIRGITSFQTGANIDPLILVDGVETSKLDLSRLVPEDIESFSVLKDASATAMYGARGANGVILVTTKKGEEGSVYASVRYEAVVSMPTKEIEVVDPKTYMRMYNQALLARDPTATPKYSMERIDRTGNLNYPSWVYPANDWNDIMFKDYSINHRVGLNIRGGSNVMQYYGSVNYVRDQGMLKTDKLNQFDVNITNSTTSFRVNLNVNLSAGIRLLINTTASFDKYHGPQQSAAQAYALAFKASPVDFAVLYPGDDEYSWPHLRFGTTKAQQENPYRLLQLGYLERTRYSATSRAEYIHNLSSLVKGLELRASVSASKTGYSEAYHSTAPALYALEDYSFETGKHKLYPINNGGDPKLKLADQTASSATQWVYEARLLHTAAWADHQTSLTGVFQAQQSEAVPVSGGIYNSFEHRNLSFSMRGTYGFKDRYFLEGSFGYNGSERFAKKNRMGFFPAVGGAWIVSKEGFMGALSKVIPFFKLRFSWGKVGNDGVIDEPRFVYLPTITDKYTPGIIDVAPNGQPLTRYQIQNYGDPGIQWEVAEQMNLGVESKFFDGILELNADFYQEIRHNIIASRTVIPANMGVELAPLDNIGKARSRGIDLSGKIQHAFSSDLWIILNGTFTYNKAIYKELEEATDKPAWQRKVGHELSQQVGYIAEGLFRDQQEIDNAPVQGGDIMPGDIRYRDIDGNGVIDVRDAVHIGFPETPRVIYGFSGFINYKNWEFNFAFQGSGKRGFFINPAGITPFYGDNAMLKAIADDHWSEDNMTNRPFWPRLSTKSIVDHNPQENWYDNKEVRKSTYFMRECSFLRCTSLELAYNLPETLTKRLKMQNVKFFARANNPFMITNFKLWDVELGEYGFNYPIQKTYAIGLNVSF